MLNSITAKSIGAIAAIALAAGLAGLLTSVAPEAKAETQPKSAAFTDVQHTVQPAKDNRLPVRVTGVPCSEHIWPNYEQSCLARPAGQARTVRSRP